MLQMKPKANYLGGKALQNPAVVEGSLVDVGLSPENQDDGGAFRAHATKLSQRKGHVNAVLDHSQKPVLSELAVRTDLRARHDQRLPPERFPSDVFVDALLEALQQRGRQCGPRLGRQLQRLLQQPGEVRLRIPILFRCS